MFDKLFRRQSDIIRHQTAPFAEERKQYLEHCAAQGHPRSTLRKFAAGLFTVAQESGVCSKATPEHLKAVANQIAQRQFRRGIASSPGNYRQEFLQVAIPWFRFIGRLDERHPKTMPFAKLLHEYTAWLQHERGLSPATIKGWRWHLGKFLCWYRSRKRSIAAIRLTDVDAFLAQYGASRHWGRIAVSNSAGAIRRFLRYAASRGWCNSDISPAIKGPRLFSYENLPQGPAWDDVKRLLKSTETDQSADIRARAVILLLAVYGLRSGEVRGLLLEDIDWAHDRITVSGSKSRRARTFPLVPTVGDAIIRYLREVRPRCSRREVFLRLHAPFRPLSTTGLFTIVRARMDRLNITSPHKGPHALRHACATHLVSEGFSLKEVGDLLGHRKAFTTQIYAKVDLPGLRKVATFDLGGLS